MEVRTWHIYIYALKYIYIYLKTSKYEYTDDTCAVKKFVALCSVIETSNYNFKSTNSK